MRRNVLFLSCVLLTSFQHVTSHDTLVPVTVEDTTFYVGSIHHDWCLTAEAEQVALFNSVLKTKRKNCLVVDVGMNDGFYTQMAGSYGCQVYSFELQHHCIEISRQAVRANKIDHLVNIIPAPVSRNNGEKISIMFPTESLCDGGFTFSGPNMQERTHARVPLVVNHTMHTIALDSFIPSGTYIDILKVDVEGHEMEVLQGAFSLLRQHRVGRLLVELGPPETYHNFSGLLEVYHEIVRLNYSLTTFNCQKKRGEPDSFTLQNFDTFSGYAYMNPWKTFWRCADLVIEASK